MLLTPAAVALEGHPPDVLVTNNNEDTIVDLTIKTASLLLQQAATFL